MRPNVESIIYGTVFGAAWQQGGNGYVWQRGTTCGCHKQSVGTKISTMDSPGEPHVLPQTFWGDQLKYDSNDHPPEVRSSYCGNRQTGTHTYTQNNYCNPVTHAPRVKNVVAINCEVSLSPLLWHKLCWTVQNNIIDVDECQNITSCEQLCMNTMGSYECGCTSGYELQHDGLTCEGQ